MLLLFLYLFSFTPIYSLTLIYLLLLFIYLLSFTHITLLTYAYSFDSPFSLLNLLYSYLLSLFTLIYLLLLFLYLLSFTPIYPTYLLSFVCFSFFFIYTPLLLFTLLVYSYLFASLFSLFNLL